MKTISVLTASLIVVYSGSAIGAHCPSEGAVPFFLDPKKTITIYQDFLPITNVNQGQRPIYRVCVVRSGNYADLHITPLGRTSSFETLRIEHNINDCVDIRSAAKIDVNSDQNKIEGRFCLIK